MFDANEVNDIIQNPPQIGVFQSNSVLNNGAGSSSSIFGSQSSNSSAAASAANDPNQTTRETGIIEKLLVCIWSYTINIHIINHVVFLILFWDI